MMRKNRKQTGKKAVRVGAMLPLATRLLLIYSSTLQNQVHGFSVDLQNSRLGVNGQAAAFDSVTSAILPPLGQTDHKQKRRKSNRKHNADPQWQGPSIPETIPLLSEVLSRSEKSRSPRTPVPKSGTQQQKSKPAEEQSTATVVEPYQAGYFASIKTQKRLKEVAADSISVPSATERATRILETLLSTPPQQCNAANIVCALTSSAKLLERAGNMPSRFETLLYQTCNILGSLVNEHILSARQLSNVAWALAKFYDVNPRIFPHPDHLSALSSTKFLGQAETWDLEKQSLCYGMDQLVDQVAIELRDLLRNDTACAKVGELAMASWAYGILRPRLRPPGWKHVPQLDELRDESSRKDRARSNNQFLIRYETWSVDDPANTSSAEPSSVTNDLLDAIADALLCKDASQENGEMRLHSCQWNELATTAWAFASHGHGGSLRAQNLLLAIASESADRLRAAAGTGSVFSRDICQLVWALGSLQSDNFRLVDGLLELVEALDEYTGVSRESNGASRPFATWSCVDIVQLVVSMAHARLDEEALLKSLYEEAYIRLLKGINVRPSSARQRTSFSSWEVNMLFWAQARLYLNQKHGTVFARFPSRAIKQIVESARNNDSLENIGIGTQEQANLAWSMTVLQAHNSTEGVELLSTLFDEVAAICKRDGKIHLEHAHQLWQALFLLEDDCPDAVKGVPQWLYEYLQAKWKAEKARAKVSSARHRALSQTLKLMGVNHVNEHDEDIDVAIVLKPKASWTHQASSELGQRSGRIAEGSIKVAVEFDGPNHFTRKRLALSDAQPRPLGQNVLKYRILKKQGWTVVRVPYYEFDKIPFWASMERQRYLQRLLKTHGNLRFSGADVSGYKAQVSNRKTRFD